MTPHWPPKLPRALQPLPAFDVWREIYHRLFDSRLQPAQPTPRQFEPSLPTRRPSPEYTLSHHTRPITAMFRPAVLRSMAAAVRTASMRPMSTTARRAAIAATAPRISLATVPRAVAWQAVRCYSAAGGLEKKDVYERIKLLLAGFDKVRGGVIPGGNGARNRDVLVLPSRCAVFFWCLEGLRLTIVPFQVNDPSNVSLACRPPTPARTPPIRPMEGIRMSNEDASETDYRKGTLCQRPGPRQPRHRRGCHGD